MDHIQKIIQHVKANKATNRKSDANNEKVRYRQNDPTSPSNIKELSQPAEDIAYTQTKKISINKKEMAERRLVAGLKDDHRNTPFKILRTQVLHALKENNWKTLAINSATQGAGKSFVATNLAVSIALELNHTVILVDLDLRRPGVHNYFGIEPEFGLQDYLKDNIPVSKLLINPGIERLVILPGKGTTSEASELLSSPKMLNLVDEVKNRYESRIVIFDLPPLLAVDDARVILPYVDAGILVVEDGKNSEDDVRKSIEILSKTNLIGTVLNKSSEKTPNYLYK